MTPALARAAGTAGLALLASVAIAAPGAGAADLGSGQFVPGEVLVGYAPGTTAAERAQVRERLGASLERRLPVARVELLDLERGGSVPGTVARLKAEPAVRYAEPNFVYDLALTPNDTDFGALWGLHSSGQLVNGSGGLADADIDAPEAWDSPPTGLSTVVVAVVDGGVAVGHPDLDGNLWTNPDETLNSTDDDGNGLIDDVAGWDFTENDNDPADLDGHGTHVAGTIAAEGNNAAGVAGVTWDAALMPLRACGLTSCTNANVSAAFAYAGEKGADVVNASLSGPGSSSSIAAAVNGAPETLFVVAAGNESNDNDVAAQTPCNVAAANLICVAASNRSDNLASFSDFGASSVDLAAPGVSTRSTYPFVVPDRASETFSGGLGPIWHTGGSNDTWARTTEASQLTGPTLTDTPGAEYEDNTHSFARFGPKDLSLDAGCHLRYEIERDLPDPDDQLLVESSTDGSGFTTLETLTGVQGKQPRAADLTGASGSATAYIRFRLDTDSSVTGDGVHLDNVRIRCPADGYQFLNGTSMASPHVAGAAALLVAHSPSASVAELRSWLLDGVDVKSSLDGVVASDGRLNLNRSLQGADGADIHRPATTITSGPTTAGTRGPARFAFAADEPSSFRCSLDGGASTVCFSPKTYRGLALGSHTFDVFAVDAAGNSDPTAATRAFALARTARCRTLKRKLRRARSRERRRTLRRKARRACRTF